MLYRPTGKGYFSGAGGLEIGLMNAGVSMRQSLDIDKRATDRMKANSQYFSHTVLNEDISTMTVLDQEKTDCCFYTFPCKKYSAIADIHGTRTGEDLFLHALRHMALEQPEFYGIENVPGMKAFPVVMEAMTKLPGYYVQIICPVNASTWLPQQRKRLIIIGTKKPFSVSPPEIMLRPKLRDILQDGADDELPDYVLRRLKGGYRDMPIIVDPEDDNAMAPTCVAHYSKDRGTRLVKDAAAKHGVRSFTVREWARLQGFPDDYQFEDKLYSYELIGNAVPVHMGEWLGKQAIKYFN
jgi:DNA (cytosine-5)-methyltransferase 1